MYDQIHQMFKDYRQFRCTPGLIDWHTILTAIHRHDLLLPLGSKSLTVTMKDCLDAFNRQWRSMSNMASTPLAINYQPKIKSGLDFNRKHSRQVSKQGYFLVYGQKALMPFYQACTNGLLTEQIFFSLSKNKFVRANPTDASFVTGDFVPVNKLYGVWTSPQSLNNPTHLLSQKVAGMETHQILKGIRAKLLSFTFPVKLCYGLNEYRMNGWRKALHAK